MNDVIASSESMLAQLRKIVSPDKGRHPALGELALCIQTLAQAEHLGDRLDAWLELLHWMRGRPLWREAYVSGGDVYPVAWQRLALFVDLLEQAPALRRQVQDAFGHIVAETDAVSLFGEAGLPGDSGFLAELGNRVNRKLLPAPREDHDLGHLVQRSFRSTEEVDRFARLPAELFARIAAIFCPSERPELCAGFRPAFADGLRLLSARVQAQGLSPKLRERSHRGSVAESPFFRIEQVSDDLVAAWLSGRPWEAMTEKWHEECARCRAAMTEVSRRLESEGISVDIVYGLKVLDRALNRMTLMIEIISAVDTKARHALIHGLLASLMRFAVEDRSIRNLVRENMQLLQRRVVERSGRTGEHYIAADRKDYWHIWLAAAGGGLLTVGTAANKLAIHHVHLAPFFEGLAAGANYAVSFLLLQAFGLMLATKQPAMTAATLAVIIREKRGPQRLDEIVDFTARIVHSQIAAAMSNVIVVALGAYAFSSLWMRLTGQPFLAREDAEHLLLTLSPVDSGTVFYSALTGVILYWASLIGGWIDNWAVFHRLPQALAEHPLGKRIGRGHMVRLAGTVSRNLAGWGTNISLGLMLGLTPAIGFFFGLPLDVRHVTLNSGALSLATASLGHDWQADGFFLRALAGIGVMFVLNLSVSFACSLWTAARAYDLPKKDLLELGRRLLKRVLVRPGDFVLPPRARLAPVETEARETP